MGKVLKQVNVFDAADGSLLATSTKYQQSMFGSGWVMVNKRAREVFRNCSKTAALVFSYLLLRQTYQASLFINAEQVGHDIGVNKSTVYRALKELEASNYLRKIRVDGVKSLVLNPNLTACGKSALAARRKLWVEDEIVEGIDKETGEVYNGDQEEKISPQRDDN